MWGGGFVCVTKHSRLCSVISSVPQSTNQNVSLQDSWTSSSLFCQNENCPAASDRGMKSLPPHLRIFKKFNLLWYFSKHGGQKNLLLKSPLLKRSFVYITLPIIVTKHKITNIMKRTSRRCWMLDLKWNTEILVQTCFRRIAQRCSYTSKKRFTLIWCCVGCNPYRWVFWANSSFCVATYLFFF